MKSIPPVLRILIGFGVALVALLFYARSGPAPMPPPQSPWVFLSQLSQQIQQRELSLRPGEQLEKSEWPYHITLLRLAEVQSDGESAFFILKVETLMDIPFAERWLGSGIELGLIDTQADRPYGNLQLVALKKLKPKEEL